MTFLAAVVTSPSYVAPLGAMIDAHARLGEVFATNPALGDYARMQTALRLFAAAGDRIELVGGRRIEPDAQLADAESTRLVFLSSFHLTDHDAFGARVPAFPAFPARPLARSGQRVGAGVCGGRGL